MDLSTSVPMVQYKFDGASLAASATSQNYLAGDRVQNAPYPRTIQGIAVIVRDNTPALGDLNWELSAGPQLLATGEGILAQTTGNEVRNPDDFTPAGMVIPANTALQLRLTNADSGGAHSARVYFLLDRI